MGNAKDTARDKSRPYNPNSQCQRLTNNTYPGMGYGKGSMGGLTDSSSRDWSEWLYGSHAETMGLAYGGRR